MSMSTSAPAGAHIVDERHTEHPGEHDHRSAWHALRAAWKAAFDGIAAAGTYKALVRQGVSEPDAAARAVGNDVCVACEGR